MATRRDIKNPVRNRAGFSKLEGVGSPVRSMTSFMPGGLPHNLKKIVFILNYPNYGFNSLQWIIHK